MCLDRCEIRRTILSGSTFELPLEFFLSNPTDVDRLFYMADVCAVNSNRNPPKNFKGTVLVIESEHNHPGFAKLKRLKSPNGSYFERPQYASNKTENLGPAREVEGKFYISSSFRTMLLYFNPSWKQFDTIKEDVTYSVYCPFWPREAQDWLKRKRDYGWPDERLLTRVNKGGCHFVRKPHQSNPNDLKQWRFSFSKAELILIHSWTPVQKHVYHLLRLVKKKISDACGEGSDRTLLTTYHFKTLMFWACEQKPSEFWNEDSIVTCVCVLLNEMVESLINRECPNYFIPENNMMDFWDMNVDLEVRFLKYHFEDRRRLKSLCAMNATSIWPSLRIWLPSRIHEYIYLSSYNVLQPLKEQMGERLTDYLCNCECFLPELKQLYKAILLSADLMSERSKERENNESTPSSTLDSIENRFKSTFTASSGDRRKVLGFEFPQFLSDSLSEIWQINQWIVELHANSRSRTLSTGNEFDATYTDISKCECMVGVAKSSPSFYSPVASHHVRESSAARLGLRSLLKELFERVKNNACSLATRSFDDYLRHVPIPLRILGAAYLANFYCVALNDYERTLSLCKAVFNKVSKMQTMFRGSESCECLIPVLVTSQWSSIFDEYVQTVVGFVILSRAVTSSEGCSENVTIRLSPISYLRYIEYRCRWRAERGASKEFAFAPDVVYGKRNHPAFVHFSVRFLSAVLCCGGTQILQSSIPSLEDGEQLSSF